MSASVTIDVRQEGNGESVRSLVRAGHDVIVWDSEGTFPVFELQSFGKAFRVVPTTGPAFALFADIDDALRFGLTYQADTAGDQTWSM